MSSITGIEIGLDDSGIKVGLDAGSFRTISNEEAIRPEGIDHAEFSSFEQ
jgi:hypothetical protein